MTKINVEEVDGVITKVGRFDVEEFLEPMDGSVWGDDTTVIEEYEGPFDEFEGVWSHLRREDGREFIVFEYTRVGEVENEFVMCIVGEDED